AFVAAIGCYAQLQPESLLAIDGVDLVLGVSEKFKLIDYLGDLTKKIHGEFHSCEISDVNNYESSFSLDDRTRAFLKVQDGCDYKCTYCTIPKARGISRSDSLENIIEQAIKITSKGIKEIVLTGVNIGDFGKGEFGNKKHQHTFLDLIKSLDEIEALKRIRISSIEPNLLSDKIIDFVAKSRAFVPHFHIPLQSGNNEILKKMKRRYLIDLFNDRVNQINILMPDACIGADVIVGFPGESDDAFLDTYKFIADLDISYLHVFSYSERPGTEAEKMYDIVPKKIRSKRSKILRGLSVKKRRFFYEKQLGKKVKVLFEHENKNGYATGFSENYLKIRTPWNPRLGNSIHEVTLDYIDKEGFLRCQI
ncbi:MiaB/RimO family radical SAM methylthiotransferase, partial [Flavobacteriaceae bacterium]|nr:MiaB/RimO family radical SAM methylthiotransferase [Flavobacteriaceae bacterium]